MRAKLLFTLGLVCLTAIMSTELSENPHFKSCDEEWGNDELWVNFAEPGRHSYTFCKDERLKDDAMFLNGRLMTLLADGLRMRGMNCGNLGPCTPGKVNKLIIDVGFRSDALQEALGLGDYDKYDKIDLDEYLKQNYILFTAIKLEDSWRWFMPIAVDGERVHGVDSDGKDITTRWDLLDFYSGWRVLPQEFLQTLN